MEVSDFEIYNGFQWNIFLTIFLIMVVFFITYMIFFRNENARYPEIALLIDNFNVVRLHIGTATCDMYRDG